MEKKEAMKILKDFHDKSALFSVRTALDTIIPELKESEGERIRKELIDYLKSFIPHHDCDLVLKSKVWISWLENQGQKETTYDEDMLGAIEYCKKNNRPLEKEHIAWLEKQGEQKANDKIEPKFKIGDWVVSPNGVYWHIDKISNNRYEVTSNTEESSNWNLDTNIYHKFTIQDAKDGDVLAASDKSLFIYNGSINENGSVGFHIAFAEDMDIILNSDDGCGWEEKDSCHPATK